MCDYSKDIWRNHPPPPSLPYVAYLQYLPPSRIGCSIFERYQKSFLHNYISLHNELNKSLYTEKRWKPEGPQYKSIGYIRRHLCLSYDESITAICSCDGKEKRNSKCIVIVNTTYTSGHNTIRLWFFYLSIWPTDDSGWFSGGNASGRYIFLCSLPEPQVHLSYYRYLHIRE